MPALTLSKPESEAAEKSAPAFRLAPHNLEAEQSLLGALLVNNEALANLGDSLRADHFHLPAHTRIFEAICKFHDRGLIANPVTLKHYFDQDGDLQALGGGAYLIKLAASAVHVINIRDYSDTIYDLALKRRLIAIGEELVNDAYAQDIDKSAEHHIEAAEQHLFNLASEGTGDKGFRALRTAVSEAVKRAEQAYKNKSRITGVDTGLDDLNNMLGGLQRSDLVILAGRPSMGKTALATNVAYNACKSFAEDAKKKGLNPREGKSVGFFSLEMSAEQLAMRLLAAACQFASTKLQHGGMSPEEFTILVRESAIMSQMPFHVDDTPALSIAALRTRARRLKRTHNLGLLIVDYLQLVRPATTRGDNRVQEVSEITQGLKAIAKELDIPVIALSQLSRAVESREDKRPMLSDLRESGSIEQDADVVMFIFREEYYVGRSEPNPEHAEKYAQWQQDMERVHNMAEVIIAKHRNGPIGNVKLFFDGNLTLFGNLAHDRASTWDE